MPGAPLTLFEREEIGLALTANPAVAWAVIGRHLLRHPTTISREIGQRRASWLPPGRCPQALGAVPAPTESGVVGQAQRAA